MARLHAPTLTALQQAKYYCTLSTAKYVRPSPFDGAKFEPLRIFKLPLPLELRDETRVRYNNIDMAATGDVINPGGDPLAAEMLRQAGQVSNEAIGASAAAIGSMAGQEGAGRYVGGKLQQAFGAEQIGSAIQQTIGAAPNPNPAVAFQGPELRDMTLTWTFMPANPTDALRIRTLIKQLKQASLPRASAGAFSVLGYPLVCQLNFFPWDNKGGGQWGWAEDSIIKMKKCFMASVNVDYSSGVAPAFFQGFNNEPVVTRLTINFKEIEYFLAVDYGWAGKMNLDNAAAVAGRLLAEGAKFSVETLGNVFGVEQPENPGEVDPTQDAAGT